MTIPMLTKKGHHPSALNFGWLQQQHSTVDLTQYFGWLNHGKRTHVEPLCVELQPLCWQTPLCWYLLLGPLCDIIDTHCKHTRKLHGQSSLDILADITTYSFRIHVLLLGKIHGPVWYTIYSHLPIGWFSSGGFNKHKPTKKKRTSDIIYGQISQANISQSIGFMYKYNWEQNEDIKKDPAKPSRRP